MNPTEVAKGLKKDIENRLIFNNLLTHWDKKLSHLNDEVLYYVMNRSESILNYRAEQNRQALLIILDKESSYDRAR
ncbi:MAG: hypothetical protein JWR59_2524 [Brevundimonas sp.]|nr:hypothetical protein [Brevundimonas sp.]